MIRGSVYLTLFRSLILEYSDEISLETHFQLCNALSEGNQFQQRLVQGVFVELIKRSSPEEARNYTQQVQEILPLSSHDPGTVFIIYLIGRELGFEGGVSAIDRILEQGKASDQLIEKLLDIRERFANPSETVGIRKITD